MRQLALHRKSRKGLKIPTEETLAAIQGRYRVVIPLVKEFGLFIPVHLRPSEFIPVETYPGCVGRYGKGERAMQNQDPLTGMIIGCCFRVANELGPGFLEKVYENALAHELHKAKARVAQQQGIEVFYDGINVGKYEADLVVEGRVIVETKAVRALDSAHVAQCLNYMRGTGLEICLLVNFGRARIQVRRLIMSRRVEGGDMEVAVDEVQ